MYSIEETIRINNPEPGGYEKQVKKNIENNSRFKKIDLSEVSWAEKLKLLQDLFGGR